MDAAATARGAVGYEARYLYLLHDRDTIFSLDWLIPLSEAHLRQALKSWVAHYNHGRAHMALGPGVPDPPSDLVAPLSKSRHRLNDFRSVDAKAILGGLQHEYSLAREIAGVFRVESDRRGNLDSAEYGANYGVGKVIDGKSRPPYTTRSTVSASSETV